MIVLNDVWSIAVDQYNYSLQKKGSKKKDKDGSVIMDENGEPQYVYLSYGYYNTLTQALDGFARMVCREAMIDKDLTVMDAIKIISSKYDELEETIQKATHGV